MGLPAKTLKSATAAILLGALAAAPAQATSAKSADSRTATESANIALLQRWYETVLGPLNPDAVDAFVAPDLVQHSKLADPGPEGVKAFLRQMKTLWPKPKLTIRRLFADGDYVIGQVHQERFEGDPGLNLVNIYRVENGRFKEHWGTLQPVEGNPLSK